MGCGEETTATSSFAAAIEQFQQRLRTSAVEDVRCRFDFAQGLRFLQAGRERRPLAFVAQHLNLDESVVRRMVLVATRISPSELERLLSLPIQTRWYLTWAHLEALATVRSSLRRRALAAEMIANCLSARRLLSLAREDSKSRRSLTPNRPEGSSEP